MYAKIHDKVKARHPINKYRKLSDNGFVEVHMEELTTTGHAGVKAAGNVWRVWYEDKYRKGYIHIKHYSDKDRAQEGFDEAVAWDGFLGLD